MHRPLVYRIQPSCVFGKPLEEAFRSVRAGCPFAYSPDVIGPMHIPG